MTTGGRGGKVIAVTNLNSSGPGSLQAACDAKGPRIVVFKVAGTIDGDIRIKKDHITIAGQTAPGDGITIKGNLGIDANDVVIRYIRARTDHEGDAVGGQIPERTSFWITCRPVGAPMRCCPCTTMKTSRFNGA